MKRSAMISICVIMAISPVVLAEAESATTEMDLAERVAQLEQRVTRLEQGVVPRVEESSVHNDPPTLRERFRARIEQDRAKYSDQELSEIESLYQVANRQWNSPEARESLRTLVEKYGQANRTGCAIMYLGQMTEGDDREKYLKKAISDFSDCFYGDGVQVGAYARFYLAHHYLRSGKETEAQALFDEIRNDYPDAIDHKGRRLAEMMQRD